ncbi:MAG TPA: DNA-directed RNA polymerase subunit delta [Firmicutes bacterium]|nr:DNA-directed RNA polymerase subunit delta [Bacillota bacterium]
MKNIQVSDEELEMMNYNDIAFLILDRNGKKMKINDLFLEVSKLLKLDDETFQSHIGDFFELLSTDKRFIMLENGFWDLKIKHNMGMETFDDEEDDDEDIIIEDEEDTDDGDYDDEEKSGEDDVDEDDLSDLVIVDDIEDEANM